MIVAPNDGLPSLPLQTRPRASVCVKLNKQYR
jgi:hypothetical protein